MRPDGRGPLTIAIVLATVRAAGARAWRAVVAPNDGEGVQVATTVRLFIWMCLLGTAAYATFFFLYDREGLQYVWVLQSVAVAIYGALIILVRRGSVTAAAVIATGLGTVQVVMCTAYLGGPLDICCS